MTCRLQAWRRGVYRLCFHRHSIPAHQLSSDFEIIGATHRSHDGPFPRIYLLVKVRGDVCAWMKMKVSSDVWIPDLAAKEDSRRIDATAANDDGFGSEDDCLCPVFQSEKGAEAPCPMSIGIVHVHVGIGDGRWSSLVRTAKQQPVDLGTNQELGTGFRSVDHECFHRTLLLAVWASKGAVPTAMF
jgi:hypothetical protein